MSSSSEVGCSARPAGWDPRQCETQRSYCSLLMWTSVEPAADGATWIEMLAVSFKKLRSCTVTPRIVRPVRFSRSARSSYRRLGWASSIRS